MKAIDEFIEQWEPTNSLEWFDIDNARERFESDLTALIEDACRERTFDFLNRFYGIIPGDSTINAVYDKYYSITNKPESDGRD